MLKKTQICTAVSLAVGGALLSQPLWAQESQRVEITG